MTIRNFLLALLVCLSLTACGLDGGGGGLSAAGLSGSGFGSEGFDPSGRDMSGTPRAAPTTMGALESS
jgi:hypothetical protein